MDTKQAFQFLKGTPHVKAALEVLLDHYKDKAVNTMATAKEPMTVGQGQGMFQLVLLLKEGLR